jgi:hypothetical protein
MFLSGCNLKFHTSIILFIHFGNNISLAKKKDEKEKKCVINY